MAEAPFKEIDYSTYVKTPFYINADPLLDAQVALDKKKIQSGLQKYKYYEDFDRSTNLFMNNRIQMDNLTNFLMIGGLLLTRAFYSYHYSDYYYKRTFAVGYVKLAPLVGLVLYFYYKQTADSKVFDRAPYGKLSGAGSVYKYLSYQSNLYQNVKLIKDKYSRKDFGAFKKATKKGDEKTVHMSYGFYKDFLRRHPDQVY